jgi:ERCC4-type nuclease
MNVTIAPFTILVDTQEKHPYRFSGMPPYHDTHHRLIIPTRRQHLTTGDYSIAGLEDRLTVERKSLVDLYGTLSPKGGRDRFRREVERMQQMDRTAIVIESGWEAILSPRDHAEQWRSDFHPHSMWGTILSWANRYPKTAWYPAPTRRIAEEITFEILYRYWQGMQNDQHAEGPKGIG